MQLNEHPYYLKKPREQRQVQLKILALFLLSNGVLLFFALYLCWYWLPILFFSISLSIIAPFFDVPSLVKSGRLKYYGPLFLVEQVKNGKLTVHGGTLFDYYFVLDRQWSGSQRTQFILQAYLAGLLALIEAYEQEEFKADKLIGTSYILNARTAQKLGFQKAETAPLQTLVLCFNYFNISCAYSLAKAKWSFPNISNINTFEASFDKLLQHKQYLQSLQAKLQRTVHRRS